MLTCQAISLYSTTQLTIVHRSGFQRPPGLLSLSKKQCAPSNMLDRSDRLEAFVHRLMYLEVLPKI